VRPCTVRSLTPAAVIAVLLPALPLCATDTASASPADSLRTSRPGLGRALVADLRLTARDAARLVTAPVRWREREWTGLAVLAAGGALVGAADGVAGDMARAARNSGTRQVLAPFEYYGRSEAGASIAGALYLGGLLSRNDNLRQTGRCALVALLLSAVESSVLKEVVGRARPSRDEGPASFNPFSFRESYHSMPSGHTTAAFALSSALACRIRNPVASAALYAAASLTALQRVYGGHHWPSDVVAGAVIGTATGVLVARGGTPGPPARRRRRVSLTPGISGSGPGCGVAAIF
jgi:membrane-associated phospholipid phosphatase